jgi:hypothetical protein
VLTSGFCLSGGRLLAPSGCSAGEELSERRSSSGGGVRDDLGGRVEACGLLRGGVMLLVIAGTGEVRLGGAPGAAEGAGVTLYGWMIPGGRLSRASISL